MLYRRHHIINQYRGVIPIGHMLQVTPVYSVINYNMLLIMIMVDYLYFPIPQGYICIYISILCVCCCICGIISIYIHILFLCIVRMHIIFVFLVEPEKYLSTQSEIDLRFLLNLPKSGNFFYHKPRIHTWVNTYCL